ncbi:hypothetical protein IFO70_03785 [Phormidium tenue FACHB-886]|nr:hypothetical protein [Phormidium tenue FACHB-886]
MKLSTELVPLRRIKASASRWNFAQADLERATQLLLEVESCINPLVLRRETGSTFEVIEGNFEYFAALAANRLNPQLFDRVEAYLVEPTQEKAILQQVHLFRRPSPRNAEPDRLIQAEAGQTQIPPKWSIGGYSADLGCSRLLETFNVAEVGQLQQLVKRVGIVGKTAERVVEAITIERSERPFQSLKEVAQRIKGFSFEKVIDLIELDQ